MAGMRGCAQGMKLAAVTRALRGQLPDQVLDHATALESQAGQRSRAPRDAAPRDGAASWLVRGHRHA